MPVIEQAKGIIMVQSQRGDGQAFDLLVRASQRSNVPVRDLAAQIVAKTAQVSPEPTLWRRSPAVRQPSAGVQGEGARRTAP
jgi:ANTAR domain-containing protein